MFLRWLITISQLYFTIRSFDFGSMERLAIVSCSDIGYLQVTHGFPSSMLKIFGILAGTTLMNSLSLKLLVSVLRPPIHSFVDRLHPPRFPTCQRSWPKFQPTKTRQHPRQGEIERVELKQQKAFSGASKLNTRSLFVSFQARRDASKFIRHPVGSKQPLDGWYTVALDTTCHVQKCWLVLLIILFASFEANYLESLWTIAHNYPRTMTHYYARWLATHSTINWAGWWLHLSGACRGVRARSLSGVQVI